MPAAVETRLPLHDLRMSATQRPPKRRSERLQRDDDDETVVKRTRSERDSGDTATGSEVQTGRTRSAAGKRTKASYEDQDGFTFKRTGAKRQKLKPTIEEGEKTDESIAIVETEPRVPVSRPRKPAQQILPTADVGSRDVQTARKSQRISSSPASGAGPTTTPLKFKPRRKTTLAPVEAPPTPESQPQADRIATKQPAEDPSNGTRVISLPFADTPVIQRNKEFRAKGKTQNRRSSSGLRGRRASSLIDSGSSSALPHGDVETKDFYKHIEQSLLEPQRMKQLLVWCGTRSMLPKQPGGLEDASEGLAVDSARQIEEELLKDVMMKPEMSNWFSRNDVEPTTIVKKPNPRNMQNTTKLKEIEQEVERLRLEKSNWDTILEQSKQAPVLEPLPPLSLTPIAESAESAESNDSDPTATMLSVLSKARELGKTTRDRADNLATRIEPCVDLLADGLHRIGQYRLAAAGIAERILESATTSLESEQQRVHAVSGTHALSHKDVLGALGNVLGRQRD